MASDGAAPGWAAAGADQWELLTPLEHDGATLTQLKRPLRFSARGEEGAPAPLWELCKRAGRDPAAFLRSFAPQLPRRCPPLAGDSSQNLCRKLARMVGRMLSKSADLGRADTEIDPEMCYWTTVVLPRTAVPMPKPWPVGQGRDDANDWFIVSLGRDRHLTGLHWDGRTAGAEKTSSDITCQTAFMMLYGSCEVLLWGNDVHAQVRQEYGLEEGQPYSLNEEPGDPHCVSPAFLEKARKNSRIFDKLRDGAPKAGVRYMVLKPGRGLLIPRKSWHWVRPMTCVTIKFSSSVVEPRCLLPADHPRFRQNDGVGKRHVDAAEDSDDDSWSMSEIIGERRRRGATEYRVRWSGAPTTEWLPGACLNAGCSELLDGWRGRKRRRGGAVAAAAAPAEPPPSPPAPKAPLGKRKRRGAAAAAGA